MNLSYNSTIGIPQASFTMDSPTSSSSTENTGSSAGTSVGPTDQGTIGTMESMNDSSSSSSPSSSELADADVPTTKVVYTQEPYVSSISPFMIVILVVVLILFIILFSSLANPASSPSGEDIGFGSEPVGSSDSSSGTVTFLTALMWGTFIVVVILNGMQYFYNINFSATISKLFTMSPALDITVDPADDQSSLPPVPEIMVSKQVFHIPGNKYNYENAEALCKAYGARLASYSEVENAYDEGGEWCSYGWSKDQMALFPTQKETWTELQSVKGHENDCGRPGINGGYIANPNVRFGANCYGYKPKMNQAEKDIMDSSTIYPKTMEDVKQEKRVEYWKRKIPDILVAPFNDKVWSLL